MPKWYEVKSVEVKRWLVEVESSECEEDAINAVADTILSDADDSEYSVIGNAINNDDSESLKRHTAKSRILRL